MVCYNCNNGTKNTFSTEKRSLQTVEKKLIPDGVWAEREAANALFIVRGDSILNIEDRANSFHYTFDGDTLKIDYKENGIGMHFILRADNDSLILRNQDSSVTKLYNRGKY